MQNIKELKGTLEKEISLSNQVFITFHNGVDTDAIASALGMNLIVNELGKKGYIILEQEPYMIESSSKKILEEFDNKDLIIRNKDYDTLKTDNDLLIIVDTNKEELVCCKDNLKYFKNIIIIDHHYEGETTIKTENKYIVPTRSSASEIIAELICMLKIKNLNNIATYLLTGIFLDTNKYTQNTSSKTINIISKLVDKGADIKRVNGFFERDFVTDMKIINLVSRAQFFTYLTYNIAMCLADENIIYTKEELARAADYLLKYKLDASFAAGHIAENIISISARSKGDINVGSIMTELGGGGNLHSAASQMQNEPIFEIEKKLTKTLNRNIYPEVV